MPPETYTGERGIEIKKNRDLFLGNESLYALFATVKRKVVGDNKGNLCLRVQWLANKGIVELQSYRKRDKRAAVIFKKGGENIPEIWFTQEEPAELFPAQ